MSTRSALVTGSTQGLGLAIARRLASEGCDVVLNGLGDPAAIEAARATLERESGRRILYCDADLSRPAEVERLVATTLDGFGRLDILVNNAVVRHFAPVEDFRPADWDEAMAVNLSAAFHAIRLAVPGMRRRDFGRIVNIASVYGLFGGVDRVAYVTTKTALIGLTRAVALETAAADITCNAICPGTTPTPAIERRLAEFTAREGLPREQAVKAFMASRQPSGRFIAPDGVAALIAFLCGPEGRDVTGAALPVDGAWSAS